MSKRSIHHLNLDQLAHLFSVATDKEDESDAGGRKFESTDRHSASEKLQDLISTDALHESVERVGSWIGPYRLMSILGEGGMGIVYLAEQQRPIKRQIALKVVKPGMDSKRVVARFEAERQALALLDHPNIAHVHDGGTTENGRPYFVMEYVKGLPMTEYCDSHKLTIEDRLNLFRQVCLAVHHAHQKGIIHRDIKPSNILVLTEDDQAVPKIIDFGVAKALAQPLIEWTLATEDSQLLGTPEYMSPEQSDMANEDIDTRSDIYSLGVLLYVLLTGVLPFDSTTFREGGIEHIRQIIRETDPKTPSTRLTKLGEEAKKIAESRGTEVTTLARRLHKELEWIPLKAMRKERSERYRSASELADDIENYLNGEPLIAGPPGTGYKLKKFVRRNRILVSGIAALLFVLIAGVVVSTIFAIGQARARTEAQLIADFLGNDVLASVGPGKTKGKDVTFRYVLDAASENLEGRFKDQPLVEAYISFILGRTYRHLGELTKAEQHYERAIQLYQRNIGDGHPDTLWVMTQLGWIYWDQGQYHDMQRQFTETLQISQRIHDVIPSLEAMNGVAYSHLCLGRYKDAESWYEKIFRIVQNELGEENWPDLFYRRFGLARVYTFQGRYEEAERLFMEAMKTAKYREEASHFEFYHTTIMADLYREWGRYKQAESLYVKTLDKERLVLGNEHVWTLICMYGLARLYTAQNRHEQAENLFNEMLEIAPRQLGEEHPNTLSYMNGYAVLLTKQKRYDEAEPLFKKALEGRRQKLYEDHPDTLESKNDLAMLYKEIGDYDKAEPLLMEALEGRRLKLGDTHPQTLESLNHLIELYEAWNKPEKANEWRAKLPQRDDPEERD
jgi:serine/threonine protein kinase/Tfp pilus assembly protein PilF